MALPAVRTPIEFAKLVFEHPEVRPARVLIAQRYTPGGDCVFCPDKTEKTEWTIAWVDQSGTKSIRSFHTRHFKEEMQ